MNQQPKGPDRLVFGLALGGLIVGATAISAAPTAPYLAPVRTVPVPSAAVPLSAVDVQKEGVDTAADAEARNRAFAEAARAMRGVPGAVRAALVSARATIRKAPGMRDVDRRAALSSIDQAIAGLEWRAGPLPQ